MGAGAERAGGAPGSTAAAAGRGRSLPQSRLCWRSCVDGSGAGAGAAARRGVAPRLARAASMPAGEPRRLEPTGTVLITGGTGELGRAGAAPGLTHGVRQLRADVAAWAGDAGSARSWWRQLTALGAETVQVVACDVADRAALGDGAGGIPAERPLTGVFHLAGVLDDGIVPALTAERLQPCAAAEGGRCVAPARADGGAGPVGVRAVLVGGGRVGGRGQAQLRGGNAFLDALAAQRRAAGPAGHCAWRGACGSRRGRA